MKGSLMPLWINFFVYGDRCVFRGQYKKAFFVFSVLLVLGIDKVTCLRRRALIRMRLADFDNAIHDCNQALSLDPEYSQSYESRAKVYQSMQRYDQALQDYRRAVELCVDDLERAWTLYLCGQLLTERQLYGQAIEEFSNAIDLEQRRQVQRGQFFVTGRVSRLAIFFSARAAALINVGKLEEAFNDSTKAVNLADASNWIGLRECLIQRSHISEQLGHIEAATNDMKRAETIGF